MATGRDVLELCINWQVNSKTRVHSVCVVGGWMISVG